ncbi:hypothetical protein [Coxiella burnetii]|uniref:hypothetical protein n=1 Tax=Coxiella burnetii TaxID=777 RepID=UPI0028FC13A7|nr:hypothetical protein [Coxiella burnetii]
MGVSMSKIQNAANPQEFKLYHQLCDLEKKEKQTYEALAALVVYIDGKEREWETDDFNKFKKTVLASAGDLAVCEKAKAAAGEPKFNVKHYERAILCASDATYRDMAIQAANKDLTDEAMGELIAAISRDCRRTTRELKEIISEWRKIQTLPNSVQKLWQAAVEPVFNEAQ